MVKLIIWPSVGAGPIMMATAVACLSLIPPLSASAIDVPFSDRNVIATGVWRTESVQLGDINRDGWVDVLSAGTNRLIWLQQADGSGTNWIPHEVDASFLSIVSVSLADLDGDGDLDILGAASGSNNRVAWWENLDGLGQNWNRHEVDELFDGARSVSAVDLDGNGTLDVLAAASVDGELAWWSNVDGSGLSWDKQTIVSGWPGASSASTADIDRDGRLDVIASASSDNQVAWWKNNIGGSPPWIIHLLDTTFTGAQAVAVADIDGDGDWDVVGAANINPGGRIVWWENLDGSGSNWNRRVIAEEFDGAYAIDLVDVDGDGDVDVVAAAQVADEVTWFENVDGLGGLWSARSIDPFFDGVRAVVTGDLDGDGDADVVAAAWIENKVAWWRNETLHRSAVFCAPAVVASIFRGAQSLVVVDRDRDGDPDIIGAAAADNRLAWWENTDGVGGVWLSRTIATNVPGAWVVASADINRSGVQDVVAALSGLDTIAWWRDVDGSGLNWQRHDIVTNFSLVRALAVADLDRNGSPDVLGGSYATGEVRCWLNVLGNGTMWTSREISTDLLGASSLVAADIDGDGLVDVVGAGELAGKISWWRNVSGVATQWQEYVIDAAANGAMAVAVADMDGDGDLDVAGAAFDLDEIAWWENLDGLGTTWIKHSVDQLLDGASVVSASDLDGDGDVDLAGGASVANQVVWWENANGAATSWIRHELSGGDLSGSAIVAADVDRDGKPDLVVSSPNSSDGAIPNIIWWKNRGGQFAINGSTSTVAQVSAGSTNQIQSFVLSHRGRAGDGDLKLTSLTLQFEKTPGHFMTSSEANTLIKEIRLYRDDGSGGLEIGSDTLAFTVSPFVLTTGRHIVAFAEDNSYFDVTATNSNTYFMVLTLSTNASQLSFAQFRITLLTSIATAEDRDRDVVLSQECPADSVANTLTLLTMVDVAITKTAIPHSLELDPSITFYITVTNRGFAAALNVVVTDAVPPVVSVNMPASSPDCYVSEGIVICHAGTLTGQTARTFTIAATVHSNAYGALTNVATVSTTSLDTNPANNMVAIVVALPDTDADGVPDFIDTDDDGDGVPDAWEMLHGLNRTNAVDALDDPDGDHVHNRDEYLADTNPHDASSLPIVYSIAVPSSVQLLVPTSSQRMYSLQLNQSIDPGAWSNVPGQFDVPGSGSWLHLEDSDLATSRLYRIKIEPPPAPPN